MSIRDDFFAAQAKASLWDVAVSIKRGNPLPLDANAVYNAYGTATVNGEVTTYTAGSLLEYAKTNPVAYPGQICAVVDVDKTTIYYLDQNLDIQPVGIIPTGDNKTIEVTANGAISLLGAAGAANGTLPMVGDDGKLTWKTLEDIGAGDGNDNTTYEFEANEEGNGFIVTPLFNGQPIYEGEGEEQKQVKIEVALDVYTKNEVDEAIKVLADKIGIEATEEDDATGLYGLIAAEVARATGAESALSARIGAAKTDDADATGVYAYVDGVVEALVNGVDPEKIDSLNELIAWVEAHPAIVEELNGRLDKVEEILDGIGGENEPETVVAAIEAAEGRAATDAQTKANTAKSEAIADAAEKYYGKSDVYTKSEADAKIDEKIASVTGGESAADVKLALESYRNAANSEIWGADAEGWTTTTTEDGKTVVTYTPQYGNKSRIDLLEEAVDALEAVGAQANVIEAVEGAAENRLSITKSDKTVTIDDANLRTDIAAALKAGQDAGAAAGVNANAIAGHDTRISTLETAKTGFDTAIKALQDADTTANSKILALETTVNNETSGVAANYAATVKNANDIATLLAQDKTHGDEIAALKTLTAGHTTDIQNINAALGNVYTKNEVYAKTEIDTTVAGINETLAKKLEAAALADYAKTADVVAKTVYEAYVASNDAAVKANADAIALLNEADSVEGSVKHTVATELAKIISDDDADIDTLNEIAAWIINDTTGAAKMANDIARHETAITTTLPAAITAAQAQALADAKKYTDEAMVKADGTTIQNTEGTFSVKAVSTDLLTQGTEELILNGGSANA